MFRWIPYPMVRVTALLIGGILAGLCLPDFGSTLDLSIVLVIILLSYAILCRVLNGSGWLKFLSGCLGLSAVFLGGYMLLMDRTQTREPSHFSKRRSPSDYYLAEVIGYPSEKKNSTRIEISIEKVHASTEWSPVMGKCLLYISKEPKFCMPKYGDRLLVAGMPVPIPKAANPGEFDYSQYLSLQNITHQQFVRPAQVRVVDQPLHRGMIYYSQEVRNWASNKIDQFVTGGQNRAVAKALVLGVTDGIDHDLQGAYAASGTLHVLSVSGLHVGIIYGIILFLLRPLSHYSWSRWVVAMLSLSCLWSYAFITGLSPSVLRAVSMFSFMAIARPFAKDTNIYNTLAASAFLLLLYDPFLILSVGFQLSYMALIGIVYLQRPLYQSWNPQCQAADKTWQVLSMSLAAQLATFPLGLYYFHQFPVYFLFSNLVIIPLSSAALVLGVTLMAVSPLNLVGEWTGWLLQFTIELLNRIVLWIEELPYSVIDGIWLTGFQCGLLIGIIVVVIRLFETRKFAFVTAAFLLVVAFEAGNWKRLLTTRANDQLVVYQVPDHGALEWIKGDHSFFYSDSSLLGSQDQLQYHVEPGHLMRGIPPDHWHKNDARWTRSQNGFQFFHFGQTRVVWIRRPSHGVVVEGEADYIVVGNDALSSLDQLKGRVKFWTLILDSSNSTRYVKRLVAEGKDKNISVYSVLQEGAFISNRQLWNM